MSLNFNGTLIKELRFNGVDITYLNFNGVIVWSKERTITLSKGNYISSVSGGGVKIVGASVTVTAVLNTDTSTYKYGFDGWYKNGVKVSSSISYTFTVDEDVTLEARGKVVQQYVTVTARGTAPARTPSSCHIDLQANGFIIPQTFHIGIAGYSQAGGASGGGDRVVYKSSSTSGGTQIFSSFTPSYSAGYVYTDKSVDTRYIRGVWNGDSYANQVDLTVSGWKNV